MDSRLTWKTENGTWGLKHYDIKEVPRELYGAICKLKDYEESGLSPDECRDLAAKKREDILLELPCKIEYTEEKAGAYDVDKVVEQLQELNENEFTYGRVMHIVKTGGLN